MSVEEVLQAIGARDDEIRRAFDCVALEALLDTLDERQRTIVKLYYEEELTQSGSPHSRPIRNREAPVTGPQLA